MKAISGTSDRLDLERSWKYGHWCDVIPGRGVTKESWTGFWDEASWGDADAVQCYNLFLVNFTVHISPLSSAYNFLIMQHFYPGSEPVDFEEETNILWSHDTICALKIRIDFWEVMTKTKLYDKLKKTANLISIFFFKNFQFFLLPTF